MDFLPISRKLVDEIVKYFDDTYRWSFYMSLFLFVSIKDSYSRQFLNHPLPWPHAPFW